MGGYSQHKEPEPACGAAVDALSQMIAEISSNAADLLTKSCLYFTVDNIESIGPVGDMDAKLERLDPALRAALVGGSSSVGLEERFRALAECKTSLYASVHSAQLAAQIFRLLRDSKTPSSGLMPLCKVINMVVRAIRAAAFAMRCNDPALAKQACVSLTEAEVMGRELIVVLPSLATYRSPTLCRMIQASVFAALTAAAMLTETATRLTTGKKAEIVELKPL